MKTVLRSLTDSWMSMSSEKKKLTAPCCPEAPDNRGLFGGRRGLSGVSAQTAAGIRQIPQIGEVFLAKHRGNVLI